MEPRSRQARTDATGADTRRGRQSDRGIAMMTALMVMLLTSSLLVGFTMLVINDNRTRLADQQHTVAFYASHAGLEKLTADLGNLFTQNYSPNGTNIANLTTGLPSLGGASFATVDNQSGYTISYTDANHDNAPDTVTAQVASGAFQGFTALVTNYTVATTAQAQGGGEVRLERTLQTVAIPVFQFGIFSQEDLSFFPGPTFNFGGRVHTNGNLFLASGSTLTLADRVTAVGEVIRTNLSNGWDTNSNYTGTVNVATAPGSTRALARTEGSLVGTLGSAQNSSWQTISMTTYNGYLRNGRTGVSALNLPLVQDGAQAIDIIRRPDPNNPDSTTTASQRFFNMATLRILLGDATTELLPPYTATNTAPISLETLALAQAAGYTAEPFATSSGVAAQGYQTAAGTSLLGGFIKIERQNTSGAWTDVTAEILNLGIAAGKVVDPARDPPVAPYPNGGGGGPAMPVPSNNCANPAAPGRATADAVIRLERIRDYFDNQAGVGVGCGLDAANRGPAASTDYIPLSLYDPREGIRRDVDAAIAANGINNINQVFLAGVMYYVELDVNNFRRWIAGQIGVSGPNSMNTTGYVVYFSDRRGNRDFGADNVARTNDDRETGELGFEDFVNPASGSGIPNNVLDTGEDVNRNNTLQTYGNTARPANYGLAGAGVGLGNVPGNNLNPAGLPANEDLNNDGNYDNGENDLNGNGYLDTAVRLFDINPVGGAAINDPITGAAVSLRSRVPFHVARANRPIFFRRALKVVNGGLNQLPANGLQGLTIASENPVYVMGNYNSCGTMTATCAANGFGATGDGHVSAAVVADSVSLLARNFNDLTTFLAPHNVGANYPAGHVLAGARIRAATTTWYRLGIISGKGISFPRPTSNGSEPQDFGTDGGTHNFLRYIQDWGGQTLWYRGSIISFYPNRQAVGTYKCCTSVYSPPTRGYNFDVEFLQPTLLPPRTPMFRDVNATGFTQRTDPCSATGRADCHTQQ
ncbi:MAG: hypothetical protein U0Q12_24205 [Vicinamibacterales bacterium]